MQSQLAVARGPADVRNGFSLVELLVVMAIIGLLAAITVPAVTKSRQTAKRMQCQNNLRNIGLGLLEWSDTMGRFPACGNFGRDPMTGGGRNHHSWVVEILPWIEQDEIFERWDRDLPLDAPGNAALAATHIPLLTCPVDLSVNGGAQRPDVGDLSYVVNGGIGFTVQDSNGVHDCPVDPRGIRLDLNHDGVVCPTNPGDDSQPTDRAQFFKLGLFFNETWNWDVTRRHHRFATINDGTSQTMLVSENVRTGFNPSGGDGSWASPFPLQTSFYIGNPCPDRTCRGGVVDWSRANRGLARINAGLTQPEGESPYPSSFHDGGVNMMFCDGHISFLAEDIDGAVYAALASPQGLLLDRTKLQQVVISGSL